VLADLGPRAVDRPTLEGLALRGASRFRGFRPGQWAVGLAASCLHYGMAAQGQLPEIDARADDRNVAPVMGWAVGGLFGRFFLGGIEEAAPVVEAFFDSFFLSVFGRLVIDAAFGKVGLGDIGSFVVVAVFVAFAVAEFL